MGALSSARFEFGIGFHSVRGWLDYSFEASKDVMAEITVLRESISRLKEEAKLVETEEDEIYNEVKKDVEERMAAWLSLSGEEAEAYVEKTKEVDAAALKDAEDAYLSKETDAVDASDVAYTKTYTKMLTDMFALERLNFKYAESTEDITAFEDAFYAGAGDFTSLSDFMFFQPTWDLAKEAIEKDMKALKDKYITEGLPSTIEVTVAFGTLLPTEKQEIVEHFKDIDAIVCRMFDTTDCIRTYGVKGQDNAVEYSAGDVA